MKDPTKRFSGRVDDYAAYRPEYPPAVLEAIKSHCNLHPSHVVADVGCGTGKFARLLVENGNFVFGVEPNVDMWRTLHATLGHHRNFVAVEGRAEDTALPPSSVDFVTAAQAFHWFDAAAAAAEFRRILRPRGYVVALWHVRRKTGTPFLEAYEQFLDRHATEPHDANERQRKLRGFLGGTEFAVARGAYSQSLNRAAFEGRAVSSSYMPLSDDPRHVPMQKELATLFETHARDGVVTIDYDTEIYYGQFTV